MQDHPSLPLQGAEQSGGALLPCRPAPPGDGVWAGPEPQPPPDRHGREHANHQAELGRQLAAKDSPTGSDAEGGSRPPGQGAGPGGPLGRPQLPPLRVGGVARPAHAGPPPHGHYRAIGVGAGQQLVGVVVQVGEDGLEVGLTERLD